MPDWQPCTMRFFCNQEQQFGFPRFSPSVSEWEASSPPKVVQALASCWRTTTEIPMKHLAEGAVRFTHFQWRRILAPETLLMLQAGGICWWGQSYHNQKGLGRVQVRVGGKDPILFGMLSTTFLCLEQIPSFWMAFTEQNASGWEPTKQGYIIKQVIN